jgi:recombination associated protein RdgC
MFKNVLIYRITQWQPPPLSEIEGRLDGSRFVECGASQMESSGWVEPRGEKHGALVETIGGQTVLKLCVERKAVPGSAVKAELEARLDKVEQETGRRPKGKRAKELKEEIVHELLPRAFPKRAATYVWLAPKPQLVVVGAASLKKADGIVSQLVELLGGGIVLAPLQTQVSPATAMSEWLSSQEAPAGFSIDRECELKAVDASKSAVRYAHHALDIEEIRQHISEGKLPTRLAMTWDDRVSFVLTESMQLRKLVFQDGVFEKTSKEKEDGFDADAAIATGEIGRLLPDLLEALGGEVEIGVAADDARPVAAPTAANAPRTAADIADAPF